MRQSYMTLIRSSVLCALTIAAIVAVGCEKSDDGGESVSASTDATGQTTADSESSNNQPANPRADSNTTNRDVGPLHRDTASTERDGPPLRDDTSSAPEGRPNVRGPRPIPPPTTVPTPRRLVGVGDFHGDITAARNALRLAGAIDDRDQWIGGDMVLVQVGDQLDRGDDEEDILIMLERLSDEAHAAGGALYPLIGNHETMNVELDFRYVTEGGWLDFADHDYDENDPLIMSYQPVERGRVAAFRPGGEYARLLAGHNTVMVVGDTLFVHGGILPEHAQLGLDRVNSNVRNWMLHGGDTPDEIHSDSPVWSRHYSDEVGSDDCALLEQVLEVLDIDRMVVAHTVQYDGINSECDGQVWRIDVGMSSYYGGVPQVLEIVGDQVRILR